MLAATNFSRTPYSWTSAVPAPWERPTSATPIWYWLLAARMAWMRASRAASTALDAGPDAWTAGLRLADGEAPASAVVAADGAADVVVGFAAVKRACAKE